MHNPNEVFILGIIAGTCTTLSFIPQVLHIWNRKTAGDISGIMYSVFALGSLLWFLYGLGLHSVPVIIANGATLILNVFVLALKFKFRFKRPFSAASTGSEFVPQGKR